MRKWVNWLFDHGVAIAYAFLITAALAFATIGMLAAVLIVHWWDRIR